jgi:hypothetical protein
MINARLLPFNASGRSMFAVSPPSFSVRSSPYQPALPRLDGGGHRCAVGAIEHRSHDPTCNPVREEARVVR